MATLEKKNLPPIDPQVRMGYVHLKVADLERAIHVHKTAGSQALLGELPAAEPVELPTTKDL